MPDKFTRTFAERLDRRSALRVSEAADYDAVSEGTGFVCPGRHCMELEMPAKGPLRLRVARARRTRSLRAERRSPARQRSRAVGKRAIGVILTGMGDDGVEGARAIIEAGGIVIAESEATARSSTVCPEPPCRAGVTSQILPLPDIGDWIARL